MSLDAYHELLTNRYVCEACLTRYFTPHPKCLACGQIGRIHILSNALFALADSDKELRKMIAAGQQFMPDVEIPSRNT